MSFQRFLVYLFLIIISTNHIVNSQHITKVPSWTKQAIWYQIFPERFSNGDQSNDPKPIDMKGAWPFYTPEGWEITPWTSDWYKLQPYEKPLGKNFYDIINIRRYGGDIQGIINKLDYLKDLGITAIYITPVFESPSLHKYDATMYHHIDNNFGPDPEEDRNIWASEDPGNPSTWKWSNADKLFLKLIKEVHNRKMKIIIDGVFNHMGLTSWAFQDIMQNQQNSKYKDWFTIKKWDDPNTKENEFDWAGWVGIKDLPEVREDENGIVTGPKEHIHSIVKRWMDPNGDGNPEDGVDGWRLDVAEMVNHNFWKVFRKWVKEINANAYIVGEVWWEDWGKNKMFNAARWLQGDEFDAVMNYRFTRANKNFVANKKEPDGVQAYIDSLSTIMNNYGENYSVMMNLLGSHDTERLSSVIVNPDLLYDHGANVRDTKSYDVRKPNGEEIQKQKLMVALQFTQPGAPLTYYGDEAGMWGGDDPDERKPMVWKEFNYEEEKAHPFNSPRSTDKVKFNENLFKWYKLMATIRNQHEVLSLGSIEFINLDESNKILGYVRKLNDKKLFVVVNNNPKSNLVLLNNFLENKKTYVDLVTGKNVKFNGSSKVAFSPYQIMILK